MNAWLSYSDRLRSMYPDGRADGRARRFSRLWAAVFTLGLGPRRWVTLEVTGRKSGRVVRFPLGMADLAGQWYLVSMLGERCNWVLNVRAADGRAVIKHRRAVACHLVEVPPAERTEILRRYLRKVPGSRPHIPVSPHATRADFAEIAPRYPVFRVVPDEGGEP
ncbi:MAG TPA: nitroreductase/quinone reductase family protein [Trebonia sp.]